MIFDRIFGYSALLDRLTDKNNEIERLITENRELRDRLFIRNALPVSGQDVLPGEPGNPVSGWIPKRERLKKFLNQTPLVATLSDEEMKSLREMSQ